MSWYRLPMLLANFWNFFCPSISALDMIQTCFCLAWRPATFWHYLHVQPSHVDMIQDTHLPGLTCRSLLSSEISPQALRTDPAMTQIRICKASHAATFWDSPRVTWSQLDMLYLLRFSTCQGPSVSDCHDTDSHLPGLTCPTGPSLSFHMIQTRICQVWHAATFWDSLSLDLRTGFRMAADTCQTQEDNRHGAAGKNSYSLH